MQKSKGKKEGKKSQYQLVCKSWNMLKIIQYHEEMMKQQFVSHFLPQSQIIFANISEILHINDVCPTENVCVVLKLFHFHSFLKKIALLQNK